jgi:hypothetical protein
LQGRAEGALDHVYRFCPGPQPGCINVRVAGEVHRRPLFHRFQGFDSG